MAFNPVDPPLKAVLNPCFYGPGKEVMIVGVADDIVPTPDTMIQTSSAEEGVRERRICACLRPEDIVSRL